MEKKEKKLLRAWRRRKRNFLGHGEEGTYILHSQSDSQPQRFFCQNSEAPFQYQQDLLFYITKHLLFFAE